MLSVCTFYYRLARKLRECHDPGNLVYKVVFALDTSLSVVASKTDTWADYIAELRDSGCVRREEHISVTSTRDG